MFVVIGSHRDLQVLIHACPTRLAFDLGKAQPAQRRCSKSDIMQVTRCVRFRHPRPLFQTRLYLLHPWSRASRDTCTSMCGAGTAVYVRVHEDSEHRATQQSGRAAGLKGTPQVPRITSRVGRYSDDTARSEESSVGKECVSTCSSSGSPYN